MKRFLLAFVLAAALLGSLAAPALAEAPWAPAFRLPTKTAYIFAYGDGSWAEVAGADLAAVYHWVSYDDDGNWLAPADPIPADYDVVMQVSWKSCNYGLAKTVPQYFDLKLSIPEVGVDLSYEQAKAYWVGTFFWDDYWVTNVGPIPAFNSHIGAKVYGTRWLLPLTGDNGVATMNLSADKKLLPGTYTVYYTENLLHTTTDLGLWFDGQRSPFISRPEGENVVPPYTFTIAPVGP